MLLGNRGGRGGARGAAENWACGLTVGPKADRFAKFRGHSHAKLRLGEVIDHVWFKETEQARDRQDGKSAATAPVVFDHVQAHEARDTGLVAAVGVPGEGFEGFGAGEGGRGIMVDLGLGEWVGVGSRGSGLHVPEPSARVAVGDGEAVIVGTVQAADDGLEVCAGWVRKAEVDFQDACGGEMVVDPG